MSILAAADDKLVGSSLAAINGVAALMQVPLQLTASAFVARFGVVMYSSPLCSASGRETLLVSEWWWACTLAYRVAELSG